MTAASTNDSLVCDVPSSGNELLRLCRLAFQNLFHGTECQVGVLDGNADSILSLAERHRVLGLLSAGLSLETMADAPDAWKRKVFSRARYTAHLASEASSIWRELEPDIPGLNLIKGPALSLQAWPQSGIRDYDDLDFRCPASSFEPFVSGLEKMGYHLVHSLPRSRNLWHYGWGICLINDRGTRVECNHRLFPPYYSWQRSLSDDESQWQLIQIEDADIRIPSPALHLIYCCAHAAWHGWERLSWLADIGALLNTYPSAYDQSVNVLKPGRFQFAALNAGCALACHCFEALRPESLPPVDRGSLAHIEDQLSSSGGMTFSAQRRHHLDLMTLRERLIYHMKRLLTPGDPDFQWINLPRFLRGLYWLLRPVRGAWNVIRRFKMNSD